MPVNAHGGTGSPNYGRYTVTPLLMISEVSFYSQRPLVHMLLSGVFERFPRLKFVVTEQGAAWVPPLLAQLDSVIDNVRRGAIGELKYREEDALPRSATEYFNQNVWVAASQPGPADVAARTAMGADRFMGERLPARRGHGAVHDLAPAPGLPRRRAHRAEAHPRR